MVSPDSGIFFKIKKRMDLIAGLLTSKKPSINVDVKSCDENKKNMPNNNANSD